MLGCPECGGELEYTPEDDVVLYYACPMSCVECHRCVDEAVTCPDEEDPGDA
jgi:hypothetical protein